MRSVSRNLAAVAFLGILMALALAPGRELHAQQAPPSDSSKPAPATPPAPSSTPAPKPSSKPSGPGDKAQPTTPAPADDNAFPEAQSQAAEKAAAQQERSDRKAASTGSVAPDDAGSSSRDKFKDLDILGDHESRTSNGAGGTIVDPKLALKDLQVGQQYMGMGNYQGAYERFKEACTVDHDNADAVFYLAEAARKTRHLDESAVNYHIYLIAQPDGPKAKAARKALAHLEGK